MIRVRVPPWALAAGMPPPGDDEGFDTYWRRQGVTEDVLSMAITGLTERTEDIANERMGTYLMLKMPDAFARYVESMRRPPG